MLFEREPQIQLCIPHYYNNNPDSIHNIVSDLQKKVDERIARIEKEYEMCESYWCKVSYNNKKIVFEFGIGEFGGNEVTPNPFETVTYNEEINGGYIFFNLSAEDKEKIKSNHMDTVTRAFLDETF